MLFYLLISFLIIFGIFLVFWIILERKKEKGFFVRGMNLALYSVTLPQVVQKGEKIDLQEFLKKAEQFFASLAGIREKSKIKKFLIGNPYLVFEIAVHRIGEEIYFYFACPRHLAEMVEKQILAFWPKAQVQPAPDYNIFHPLGFSVGARGYLTRSHALSLKPYREFSTDPLSAMTSVFTKLDREDEGAAIQILIRPSEKPIKKLGGKIVSLLQGGIKLENAIAMAEASLGFFGALRGFLGALSFALSPKEGPSPLAKPGQTPPLPPSQQELINTISEKISRPLFDVNLRVLASALSQERADQILGELQGAFSQFGSPLLNQIGFKKLSKKALRKLFYNFSFRIFNEAETMTLSSGELASIFHFPHPGLLITPFIKWLKAKQVPPPVNLPEEGLILGKNIFRGKERIVSILKEDRRRHFYIVGQTGTGKSVLLGEMIKQDIEAGEGVCLIDPHGDLAERVLSLIPPSRAEDTIYFDPADPERAIGLNMLEYDPRYPETKTFVVNELLEIFEKLYNLKALGFGGPMFEQYMRNALLLVMEDPESGSTLIEVPKVLSEKDFRHYKLSRCKNIVVKNFWELEAEKAGGEAALANMVPYITSKINIFIANDLVRPIIAQQKSAFNFREIMDQGKILIINLSKGKLGDINSYLLGMIIVGKILMAAFSRADIPEEQRPDFWLYIDEFHNVTTKTITSVLAEARKYRLGMIFGHQYIGQLDEETRKAIFGNVGSILAFRVGPDDAKYLISQFEPTFDENDLVNFDNYNAALRLLIRGETSRPFNIVTFPPSKGNPKVVQLIKEYSRFKYGRNRAQVESELYQRLQKIY